MRPTRKPSRRIRAQALQTTPEAEQPESTEGTADAPKSSGYNGEKGRFVPGNPGRPPGPNKITRDFREAVQKLLDHSEGKLIEWLDQVANGSAGNPVGDVKPIPGDPAKALELIHKLAEYAAPKLSRAEHTGKDGAAIVFQTSQADKDL